MSRRSGGGEAHQAPAAVARTKARSPVRATLGNHSTVSNLLGWRNRIRKIRADVPLKRQLIPHLTPRTALRPIAGGNWPAPLAGRRGAMTAHAQEPQTNRPPVRAACSRSLANLGSDKGGGGDVV